MKFFTFLLFISLSLGPIVAHGQSGITTPLQFNNAMADIISDLYAKGTAWGEKFAEINKGDKHFADLSVSRLEMEKYIDKKITYLQKVKDVNGSEEYRNAMIKFLEFEKTMFEAGFKPIEKLNAKSTDDEVTSALQGITPLAESEKKELDKIRVIQQDYADKNHFSIGGN